MKRIAVVGVGAMGTLLGACLNRAGIPVDLIDVDQRHLDALNSCGAKVTGKVEFTVPVRAYRPDQMEGIYDVIFLLIKQTYNETSFPQIAPHLDENSVIVTMQNGLPEIAVSEYFGTERTLGCAVTWAASGGGPGATIAQSDPEMWNNNIGRLDGKQTQKGLEIQELLSHMCHTDLTDNIAGIRWSKLIINCSFSGMGAALGLTFGQVLDNPEALRCAQYISRECIQTTHAQNIRLHPIGAEGCLDTLMDFNSEEERIGTFGIYRKLYSSCYDGKASMLQDIEKGRRTEIHYINGILSNAGRKVNVPTPYCDKVIELVEKIEAGSLTASPENLKYFEDLPRF